MRRMAEKMFIYSLSHPITNKVFYVGQSKNVYARVLSHAQKCHLLKSEKDKIVSGICSLGLLPKWEILEEISVDLSDASSIMNVSVREHFWIEKYHIQGELSNIQKIPLQPVRKIDNPKKVKSCKHCGKDFQPKNPKGKFCSDKCRVYASRVVKSSKPIIDYTPPPIITSKAGIEKLNEAFKEVFDTVAIENQIAEIRAEKIPFTRDTPLGRKSWQSDQNKRIQELQSKIQIKQ